MKKFMKWACAALMATSMVACSSSNDSEDTKVITIGISPDYAPYESLNTEGEIVGFDVDMVNLFEKYLNEDSDVVYSLEFKQMDFDNIITQIQGDQIDLGISGFSYDSQREVEWSKAYLGSSQVAILPADSEITSIDQLEGKSIAVQTGSTGEKAANEVKDAKVSGLKSVQDIMNALAAHQYDAAIVDSGVAKNYVNNSDFIMLETALLDEQNFVIAKKGNTEIIDLINTCIDKFLASDDYADLCAKYELSPVVSE
ncbi:transporter substrate-binding domain-containing protein [Floccifex sp.]|uniref:substrate-binding periplasmic protein n=1 Tax=Floccifex sp. TaxID=2815810 RepID=UPI003F04F3D2